MSNTIFRSRLLCENTWLIQGEGCNAYLLVGSKCGIMIDTGFAVGNIREYAQALTDKPINIAANTHGHFDHTGGNGWFERAYMSARALEIAKTPYPSLDASKYILEYPVVVIGDGDTIDLGGRVIEVFEIPAHALGSIAFLDRKEKILFTGDEVDDMVMLVCKQEEPHPTIEQHAKNMKKLLAHRNAFNYICAGHGQVMGDATLVEEYLENDRIILSGIEGESLIPTQNDPIDFHMPQIEFKRKLDYKHTSIGYDIRYVRENID